MVLDTLTHVPAEQTMINQIVAIEYGRQFGRPALIGLGRVTQERQYKGTIELYVEPVYGLKFGRWIQAGQVIQ